MSEDRLVSRVGFLSLAAAIAASSAAWAQDEERNPQITGFISETLEGGSNLRYDPGNEDLGFRSITTLGVEFLAETGTQTFDLDAAVALRSRIWGDDVDEADDVRVLPNLNLFYSAEGARTAIEFDGYYRLDPVDEDTEALNYLVSGRLIRALSEGISVNALAGYRSDGSEDEGDVDTTESAFFELGADYEGNLWDFGGSAGIQVFEDVVRPAGGIYASRETRRGGIRGFLGLATSRDTEVSVVGSLDIDYEINSTNTFIAGVDQRIAVDQDGDDELLSTANLGLLHEINNRSDAEVGFSFGLRNGLDNSDINNLPVANFDLGYNYALTERADLNLGYRYRYEEEEIGPSTTSHIVSVGITVPFGL